ncbi:uncharacterized protein N7498_010478 [Penicillium cinerascens]|uniref:DNA topoisomerase (ATP-hydrolyzing) n=1 Tax=Penicillium cinerascens TaxID=70096 RepID=A0A9W9J7I4_9EURO|nr:uncharacterized protein N7498_010478 [Penicillium cinerascens]KAJ5191493.1 hypothetical protein N7498_010478 [Penicillium cinerascens]
MAPSASSPRTAIPKQDRQASVRAYIDSTLTALVDQLSLSPAEAKPCIAIRCRATPANCTINRGSGALEAVQNVEMHRTYSWPGATAYESWKFTVIIRILAIIDQAVRTGQWVSKRDIYYIDPAYFRSQDTVDTVIDELAYTIGVDRGALNVEAAGKGLITGCFSLKRDSHVVVNAQFSSQDTLVPRIQEGDEFDISATRWVLVIEKEAVFHRLVQNNYHIKAVAGQGILITGKGYPDIRTREFIRQLVDATSNDRIPRRFYALVDGDPHGIGILSTYKYGSLAHLHDNASLNIPNLQWLGLKVSDAITTSAASGSDGLLTLTFRDRKKIVAMLRNNPVLANDGPEAEWRMELQRMLMLNIKAEIELMYDREGGLEMWIDRRMFRQE